MMTAVDVRGDVVVDGPGVHDLPVRFEGADGRLTVRLPTARAVTSIEPRPLLRQARDRLVELGISVDVHVGARRVVQIDGGDGSIRTSVGSALAVLLRTRPTRIPRILRLYFALRRMS